MVERQMLRQLPKRRSDPAGQLRHPFHCPLRPQQSLGWGAGTSAGVRCPGPLEEPGALADRRDCRLDARNRNWLLGKHVENPHFGSGAAARPFGGLLQKVLTWARGRRSEAMLLHWLVLALLCIAGLLGALHDSWPRHSREFWINL